jgi:predicted MPP superfamily phosphohydrolase
MELLAFAPISSPWALLLFAGALVGHLVLLVASHNHWYGKPLPPLLTDAVQLLHGFLVLAGPLVFVWAGGFDLWPLVLEPNGITGWLLAIWLVLCWLAAFVGLPIDTLLRVLRPRPRALASNHTTRINVARELGRRPMGRSKFGFLGYLPGNELFHLDIIERTLVLPHLPAEWDGLTILQITDLHMSGTPDRVYYEYITERCAALNPDLVAVTGDLVDGIRLQRWLEPVLGRLTWKEHALAILGNHDLWYNPERTRRRLRRLGMRVLGNGWEVIEVRGLPLLVIGHEGPWVEPEPDLAQCPPPLARKDGTDLEGVFRLCLSHTPDNIRWAQAHRIDLMLSGHVHGGQVRLPLFGAIVVPSRYGRRYDAGVFEEGPTLLHVCRGISGQQPLRYNCRPEVTLIVLRRAGGPRDTEHQAVD